MTQEAIGDASARFVVTGPTGWIGAACLAWLASRLGPDWAGRVALFGSRAESLPMGGPSVRPLSELAGRDVDGAYVLHLAYLTKEKAALLGDSAFAAANAAIDQAVLSAVAAGRPRGVFVASSGAASLAETGADRHAYGLGKLEQEARFLSWGESAGVPVLAGRIFNLAGPYINKLAAYALSSFLVQALQAGEVRIAARTPVYRSYLHVMDLCELIVRALGDGAPHPRPLDLCGPLVVEMQDLAQAVARATGLNAEAIHRDPVDFSRPSRYLGDAVQTLALAQRLGVPLTGFKAQVADAAAFVRARIASGRL